jgi:hypothetical protein
VFYAEVQLPELSSLWLHEEGQDLGREVLCRVQADVADVDAGAKKKSKKIDFVPRPFS